MKIINLLYVFFIVFHCPWNSYAQKKNASADFFFIQMTDPQFGFFEANKSFEKETILYQKAVDEVNRLHPAFVVITGDFVNNGADSMQWAEFDRITAKINPSIKVYYSPGNHDIGQNPTQQRIDAYKKIYGDDKFSFKYKKNRFIGFNSCIIKADVQDLEQKQFEWLAKELRKAKGAKNIVLFCHHPFFTKDPEEEETYSNIAIEKRKKYFELFSKYGVNFVFAGHYHNNAAGSYQSVQMITTSAVGKPLGKAPSGFRIIKFVNGKIEHAYYGLDEIPD